MILEIWSSCVDYARLKGHKAILVNSIEFDGALTHSEKMRILRRESEYYAKDAGAVLSCATGSEYRYKNTKKYPGKIFRFYAKEVLKND